jgi:SAM-dependent methyltransferase
MEKFGNTFENTDPWREAILVERKHLHMEKMLKHILDSYEGERKNALVLGDASLVQSLLLLEKQKFEHIVDVDSSPSLMDDDIISINDPRLERVLSDFDKYDLPVDSFDLVYGKSIAFNPKETTPLLLEKISQSLKESGLFYATWAGEGDSFREGIYYSFDELKRMYENSNLAIFEKQIKDIPMEGLLGGKGRAHTIKIAARKK